MYTSIFLGPGFDFFFGFENSACCIHARHVLTLANSIPCERALRGDRKPPAERSAWQLLYIYLYIDILKNASCTLTAQLEKAKFLLSSRPQTGIPSPPTSGPRPSFLARFRCGSRPPASAGPIPVRTLSGSRADDTERVDPELGGSCGDASLLLAALEKSFLGLLLRGDVSVLLAVLETSLFVVPEIFVVLAVC